MNEMVERVARRLAFYAGAKMCGPGQHVASREFGWKPDGKHLDEYADGHWREHEHTAIAVIEEICEPTDAMSDAGYAIETARYERYHPQEDKCAVDCWRAMAGAALKD